MRLQVSRSLQISRGSFIASTAAGLAAAALRPLPALAARTSLLALGCKGDGRTDDREAFLRAVATGQPLTGEGRWYGIAGDARFMSAIGLGDAGFIALNPGCKTRVLFKTGPAPIRFARVKVNRNGSEGTLRKCSRRLVLRR